MATDLVVSVQIQTSPGVFLELEDEAGGYELEASSLRDRNVTYRQQTADTPWTEGTVVFASVRENVTETVAVWVTGVDHHDFDQKVQALTNALEQLAYTIVRTIANSKQTWTCMPAQYTVTTQQEYLFATTGLVTAQVPRYPTVLLEAV